MARSLKQVAGDETVHYVPARKMRAERRAKMQPPLTPMIDVVFQLLLFFLLTTEFRQEEGLITAALPEKGEGIDTVVKTKDIIIELHPIGFRGVRYVFADMNVGAIQDDPKAGVAAAAAPAAQVQRLEQRRDEYKLDVKDSLVIIKPAGDVRWRFIVEAFNQAVRAKFEKIAFAPS